MHISSGGSPRLRRGICCVASVAARRGRNRLPVFIMLLAALWLFGAEATAQHRVTGTVTSAEDGLPMAGVNVLVVGTTTGTATNTEGEYELVAPSENATLRFSFIGFETQEIPIDGRDVIDVLLQVDPILGEELVVVGYGVQRRRDVTGAISRVEGDEISKIPTPSAEQALQGRVAGVQVIPNSGEPGSGATVRIRGVGTLNDASPLYVVDGMLVNDIGFLNPNDIESMDVLKDASATAIYGSRGANGVVIVSTRRASTERPVVSFSTWAGVEQLGNRVDMVNAREYAMLANELAQNEGISPFFDDPEAFGEGTDWQDEVYRSAPMQNYQVSASGTTDAISYYISGNFTRQDGIIPRSEYQRGSLRLNNQYFISDFVTVGHNLTFTHTDSRAAPSVIATAYRADPTVPVFNEEGDFADASVRAPAGNPMATIEFTNNDHQNNRIVGNAFVDIDLLQHFTFRSSYGVDVTRGEGRTFVPEYFVSPIQQSEQTSISVFNNFTNNWLWENTLTYQQFVEDHSINVVAGVTAQEFRFEELAGSRMNVVGEARNLWYLNAADAETQGNFNSAYDWGMISYLARANYGFMDKYLLTVTGRVDGSSRFGSDKRYGFFPSVALGWRISDEPFLRDVRPISELKFRGSYGVIGNDRIGAYPGRPTITSNLNAVFGRDPSLQFGASLVDLANPEVAWESTSQFNIGLNVGMFENRLTAEFDYYNRTTDDILVQVPIPAYVGANSQPFVNAARVRNQGVDYNVTFRDQIGGFTYRIGTVGSTVQNEVLSLGEGREEILGGPVGEGGKLATRTVVGQPIGSFYGYRVEGVFQNQDELEQFPRRGPERPGDLRFADVNGDGVITTDDRTFLGSPIPDFIFGFNAGFGYGGFDLDIDFNGQTGNVIYNAKRAARFGTYNFERTFLDRWTGEGTSDTEPRLTNAGHNYEVSERFLEDGSYLKLRNVRLSYTLPGRLAERANMRNMRVYLNATNLFTVTEYTGYTPEIIGGGVLDVGIDRGFYPPNRSFTIGLDFTL
ncbi:MAG: SusC/RagA family TonB-linked outer membrane protein [Bacteroidota bacterium]